MHRHLPHFQLPLRLVANKIVQPAKTKFVRNFLNTALAVYMAFSQSTPHQLSHILTSTFFYSKAHQAQFELETICKSTALLNDAQPYFAGVKSKQRAEEKIALELDGKVERITDLARATIVAEDVASLVSIYETLERETTIVKVKNRFKKPGPSGYRDLNLLVRLPKTNLVAEVQLHLKAIADVKSGPEHDLYEKIQKLRTSSDVGKT
ncbi:hypothetical protein VMC_18340 [Vibrio alginolyticus 40B]|nr:hypothetical protein VMC_18340 [Vibrio alginolyticus 40B]